MSNLRETLNKRAASAIERITADVSEKLYNEIERSLYELADNGVESLDLDPLYKEYLGEYSITIRNKVINNIENRLASGGVNVEHSSSFGNKVSWIELYKSEV